MEVLFLVLVPVGVLLTALLIWTAVGRGLGLMELTMRAEDWVDRHWSGRLFPRSLVPPRRRQHSPDDAGYYSSGVAGYGGGGGGSSYNDSGSSCGDSGGGGWSGGDGGGGGGS